MATKSRPPGQSSRCSIAPYHKYASPELQQSILSLLRRAFSAVYSDPETLADTIQSVKAHLYARDYAAAFESPDYLLAYAVRWSSSRALAYLHVLGDLCPHISEILTSTSKKPNNKKKNILCIGGGAGGEVLALATLANDLGAKNVNILAIDIAHWDDVFLSLRDGIRRGLGWDKKEESDDIAKDSIQLNFSQMDILDVPCYLEGDGAAVLASDGDALEPAGGNCSSDDRVDFGSLDIITIMFTTNELFAQSKPKTLTLFRYITDNCRPGTLLVLLESAGSYSHIQIGSKTFPVQFLLDHIMVDDGAGWEKVVHDDAAWFRIQKDLKYPLELENMRFFLRLYRRI
ncbi:uncharacterized protein V1513DRAFT_444832 [Lipomyces chichibuensis]|uniref:uncharacterized protein n=1 Tax=Lipomyces chichibuensis TaxID=1546026 RepID=UPI00334394E3